MKFKVDSARLIEMLKVTSKGFDQRDDSSIIITRVDPGANTLEVTSRCQSSFFSGKIDILNLEVDEDEELEHYVDGTILKKLIGILPSAAVNITFSVSKTSRVFTLAYSGNKLKLPITSDTTRIVRPEIKTLGMVQANDFMDTIDSLLKIVSTDPSTQEHPSSCLHLKFQKDEIELVGTDAYSFAEVKLPFTPEQEEYEPEQILVKQAQGSLLSMNVDPAEVLKIVYSDNYFGFIDGNNNLSLVGRIDMAPLPYQRLLTNASDDHSVTINKNQLKDALNTIAKLAFTTNSVLLKMNAKDKTLKVTSATGDVIDVNVEDMNLDEDTEIQFTRTVLQKSLIPAKTDLIRIEWGMVGNMTSLFRIVLLDDSQNAIDNVFIGAASDVVSND